MWTPGATASTNWATLGVDSTDAAEIAAAGPISTSSRSSSARCGGSQLACVQDDGCGGNEGSMAREDVISTDQERDVCECQKGEGREHIGNVKTNVGNS